MGEKGDQGEKGEQGEKGDQGKKGEEGQSGGYLYLFATSESVNRGQYIGLGNSSTNTLRNTMVIVNNCVAKTLVFSIRELADAIPYKATLYVNGVASAFTAIIPNGSTSFSIAANSSLTLTQFDLVSIYIDYTGGGALSNGVCATLLTNNL
jgi:hypothetical protein